MMDLQNKPWWSSLEKGVQELLLQSQTLIKRFQNDKDAYHDYAFIVFPAAKAYEGYLKKLFLDLKFILPKDYYGKRFRVGKALNPQLDKKYKDESIYGKLTEYCSSNALPDQLWKTWKQSRNLLFHYFPNEKNFINYPQAIERVKMIISSIDQAYSTCKIK